MSRHTASGWRRLYRLTHRGTLTAKAKRRAKRRQRLGVEYVPTHGQKDSDHVQSR